MTMMTESQFESMKLKVIKEQQEQEIKVLLNKLSEGLNEIVNDPNFSLSNSLTLNNWLETLKKVEHDLNNPL